MGKLDTHQLLYAQLPRMADHLNWKIQRDSKLTGAIKFSALHNLNGHKAIAKSGFINTVFGEYFWSRIVKLVNLPAAPVQFVVMPENLVIRPSDIISPLL